MRLLNCLVLRRDMHRAICTVSRWWRIILRMNWCNRFFKSRLSLNLSYSRFLTRLLFFLFLWWRKLIFLLSLWRWVSLRSILRAFLWFFSLLLFFFSYYFFFIWIFIALFLKLWVIFLGFFYLVFQMTNLFSSIMFFTFPVLSLLPFFIKGRF